MHSFITYFLALKKNFQFKWSEKLPFSKHLKFRAGPIAERSKSSDLDCGRGDPGSNPGEGMCFFFGMVN